MPTRGAGRTLADLDAYRRELVRVVRTLDRSGVQALLAEIAAEAPSPEIAEAAMHKARVEMHELTEAERELSRRWLRERGLRRYTGEPA